MNRKNPEERANEREQSTLDAFAHQEEGDPHRPDESRGAGIATVIETRSHLLAFLHGIAVSTLGLIVLGLPSVLAESLAVSQKDATQAVYGEPRGSSGG